MESIQNQNFLEKRKDILFYVLCLLIHFFKFIKSNQINSISFISNLTPSNLNLPYIFPIGSVVLYKNLPCLVFNSLINSNNPFLSTYTLFTAQKTFESSVPASSLKHLPYKDIIINSNFNSFLSKYFIEESILFNFFLFFTSFRSENMDNSFQENYIFNLSNNKNLAKTLISQNYDIFTSNFSVTDIILKFDERFCSYFGVSVEPIDLNSLQLFSDKAQNLLSSFKIPLNVQNNSIAKMNFNSFYSFVDSYNGISYPFLPLVSTFILNNGTITSPCNILKIFCDFLQQNHDDILNKINFHKNVLYSSLIRKKYNYYTGLLSSEVNQVKPNIVLPQKQYSVGVGGRSKKQLFRKKRKTKKYFYKKKGGAYILTGTLVAAFGVGVLTVLNNLQDSGGYYLSVWRGSHVLQSSSTSVIIPPSSVLSSTGSSSSNTDSSSFNSDSSPLNTKVSEFAKNFLSNAKSQNYLEKETFDTSDEQKIHYIKKIIEELFGTNIDENKKKFLQLYIYNTLLKTKNDNFINVVNLNSIYSFNQLLLNPKIQSTFQIISSIIESADDYTEIPKKIKIQIKEFLNNFSKLNSNEINAFVEYILNDSKQENSYGLNTIIENMKLFVTPKLNKESDKKMFFLSQILANPNIVKFANFKENSFINFKSNDKSNDNSNDSYINYNNISYGYLALGTVSILGTTAAVAFGIISYKEGKEEDEKFIKDLHELLDDTFKENTIKEKYFTNLNYFKQNRKEAQELTKNFFLVQIIKEKLPHLRNKSDDEIFDLLQKQNFDWKKVVKDETKALNDLILFENANQREKKMNEQQKWGFK
jgi:hypothetical protein